MSRLALLDPALLGMGLHVAAARVRRAVRGHRRYQGSAEDILRAGLEDCWSGAYLTASPGHYRQLWTRDLGFAAPSLVRLGGPWPDRLLSSLAWALGVWRQRGSHVTTTINPLLRGPVDIFDYGVDSLPLLLASLQALTTAADLGVAARAGQLAERHRSWITAEVEHFVEQVVEPSTGLVRTDRAFSAHRDTFRNSSTAYANTMVALLARTVTETGWGPDLLSAHFETRPTSVDAVGSPFVFPNPGTAVSSSTAMPVIGIRAASERPPIAPDQPPIASELPPIASELPPIASELPPIASERPPIAPDPPPISPDRSTPLRMQMTGIAPNNTNRAADSAHTNPRPSDWGRLLTRHFWLGDRFRDRLGSDETSGEANVWPFFAGIVDDRAMLAAALGTLRAEGYTAPYPLRFEASHRAERLLAIFRVWSPDYQTTTSWTSLGSIYLALLREADPDAAAVELDRQRGLIERDGTFWEVLDRKGRAWRSSSRLSVSDQSMLWGAILLETLLAQGSPRNGRTPVLPL